ncbi:MAG: MATE family efflux transporter [Lachnospira sp.]|nr:MATE family efflux transporter [Lachnospira sp.]
MSDTKKIDMTKGPILKLIIMFALPICAGNILQQLYGTVDTFIVGKFCSSISLAAVGTGTLPSELLLCIFIGIGSGVSILVSQCCGSGDTNRLNLIVSTATSFLYMAAVPVAILGFFLAPLLLKLLQVPTEAFDLCLSYVRIIFLGVLGNMGYNFNAGILRGMGDSRSSLIFLVISCIINIVLDFLFVVVFKLEVAGAALATVIAIYSSWIFSIVYIKHHYPSLNFTWLPKFVDKRSLNDIIKTGLPLGLNLSIYSVGHIAMQTLINMQGPIFIAACTLSSRIIELANIAIASLSSAASTFSGQNYGAKKYDRLKNGAVKLPLLSAGITFVASMLTLILYKPILGLFSNDTAVINAAAHNLFIMLPFCFTYAIFDTILFFANGLGKIRYSTIVNLLALWAVRIPSGYLIAHFVGGIYCVVCYPISYIFGMICMLFFFLSKGWKDIILAKS